MIRYIENRTDQVTQSWYRIVEVDGKRLRVNRIRRGPPRRIAFSSAKGYRWIGEVRTMGGSLLFESNVNKSIGAKGIIDLSKAPNRLEKQLYGALDAHDARATKTAQQRRLEKSTET